MSDRTAIPYHPALFSGPMVRAILDGQTRRVINGSTGAFWDHRAYQPIVATDRSGIIGWRDLEGKIHTAGAPCPRCPYGPVGTRLWVRETWRIEEMINGKGSWDLNPWVWVIGFRKVDAK